MCNNMLKPSIASITCLLFQFYFELREWNVNAGFFELFFAVFHVVEIYSPVVFWFAVCQLFDAYGVVAEGRHYA